MKEDEMFTVPPVATPEAVALALLQGVMRIEGKQLGKGFAGSTDRKWLLDTYAECLDATKDKRVWKV